MHFARASHISQDDTNFKDLAMNATLTQDILEHHLERAQREIAFCQNCQPTENGKRVWRLGIPVKMSELLAKLKIPPADLEYVAESLECNNCSAMLDLTATVGLRSRSERELEQYWRKWETQYANRFRDFDDFLVEYPALGIQHRLGQQLFKALGELPRREIGATFYYSARKMASSLAPTAEDFNPPPCPPAGGQHHSAGQQAYVLMESDAGGAREVLTGEEKVVWVQKFQCTRCKGILDLSRQLAESPSPLIEHFIYGLCYRGALRAGESFNSDASAYRVARFLTDCARLHGFTGIRTKSAKHHANKLVLFTWPTDAFEPEGEPYWFDLRTAAAANP